MSSEPCAKCLSFLAPKKSKTRDALSSCCPVCLGLFNRDVFEPRVEAAIRQAADPYGGCANGRFSTLKDNQLIAVPGDVVFRYSMAAKFPQYQPTAATTQAFVTSVKEYASNLMSTCLRKFEKEQQSNQSKDYPDFMTKEEQGFLALNVILATPTSIPRPSKIFDGKQKNRKGRRKHYQTQGGHPRTTLESNLELNDSIAPLWPFNQAVEQTTQLKSEDNDWFGTENEFHPVPTDNALEIHVALWRRPFIVQGRYTKTRRDVSQTPFFIDGDNPKKRKRLGVTSIEELVVPPLTALCGGISTINNSPENNNVIYGMAKFHASGREDMDVRMILPVHHNDDDDNSEDKKVITGRPFCCEMIDALRMPTVQDLEKMKHAINHNTGDDGATDLLPKSTRYYGQSPMGVGVDPENLSFAPRDAFKNLQSETEEKHKFYGCLCWSEKKLPPLEELTQLLTTQGDTGESLFPLELKQQTPIRVLHRRNNAIRIRHILSCHEVERLDDHYFRIHISTDAGTYVKEFCHGDLGRTLPNVTNLLKGCGKIDILELDCEGIQLN